jgi:hypothetical protein
VSLKATADDRQHQGIAHELAAGHHRLGFLAEVAAGGHLGSQQITGGEMEQVLGFCESLGLGALTGPGRTKKEKTLLHDGNA